MKNQIDQDRDMWIVSEIKRLSRDFEQLKYNQPLTIERFDVGTVGPYVIGNSSFESVVLTVSSTENRTMFAMPEITFFKDSVSNANRYPLIAATGGNWTSAQVVGFNFDIDYDEYTSDGNNQKLIVTMKNTSGGSLTIYFTVAFRYVKGTA